MVTDVYDLIPVINNGSNFFWFCGCEFGFSQYDLLGFTENQSDVSDY
jgi:hypothetical protein